MDQNWQHPSYFWIIVTQNNYLVWVLERFLETLFPTKLNQIEPNWFSYPQFYTYWIVEILLLLFIRRNERTGHVESSCQTYPLFRRNIFWFRLASFWTNFESDCIINRKIPKIDFGRANQRILINLSNLSSDLLKKESNQNRLRRCYTRKNYRLFFGNKYLFMARQWIYSR